MTTTTEVIVTLIWGLFKQHSFHLKLCICICDNYVFLFCVFIDKAMDEKELSDPLNNLSVIKGNCGHH